MIVWTHKRGSPVPYKAAKYSVGVNFHGMYQAVYSWNHGAKPIGQPCCTPELAKAEAEAHEKLLAVPHA